MKFRIAYWLLLIALVLGESCSRSPGIEVTDTTVSDETEVSDCIARYFREQLDTLLPSSPPEWLFTVGVSKDSVADAKKKLWNNWKKINEVDLSESGFLQGDTTAYWRLPGKQLMPIRFLTKGEEPPGGYPMIINLHGGGQYEVDGPYSAVVNTISWESMIALSREQDDAPVLYVIPRMADDRIGSWHKYPQRYAMRKMCRLAAVSGKINRNKIYLSGTSQGGYGTIRLSTFMPDYFGAVSVVAAADAPGENLLNYRNLPLRMDVGRMDSDFSRNVYAMRWKEQLDALSATAAPGEFDALVNIQQGKRHSVDISGISGWLMGHVRSVSSSHISFLFAYCDDGFPGGAHNLGFLDWTATPSCRVLIEESVQDNEIRLDIKKISGNVKACLEVYLPESMLAYDVVRVVVNRDRVVSKKVVPNLGVMVKSLALFQDPERIFIDKVDVDL